MPRAKSHLYKKKIDRIEKKYNDKGELTELKQKESYIDYNNNFTKFFSFDFKKYANLSKGGLFLLFIVITDLNYGNEVFLADLKKKWQKSEIGLKKAISELIKYKILKQTKIKGFYILNPHIAFRGEVQQYKKLVGII